VGILRIFNIPAYNADYNFAAVISLFMLYGYKFDKNRCRAIPFLKVVFFFQVEYDADDVSRSILF